MKAKTADKKRKILRKIFGALSFTSVLFVFQACYGMPQDMGSDILIEGIVKSGESNLPIPGIMISIENQSRIGYTDNQGIFGFYADEASEYRLNFEDIDMVDNGSFLPKDTIVNIAPGISSIYVSITMNAE
jgi:hypothetical protein